MTEENQPTQEGLQAGYEQSDVNIPRILTIVAGIAIFLAVAFVVMNSVFIQSKENLYYEQVLKPGSKKLQQLHQREAEMLHSYAVVDSANNVYRIPIERAMKLEADEAFQRRKQSMGNN
ncbi:MAG: hypothetical protein K9N46_13730 [Candidatus Marinimicrobia bacterium]|nr:hypothetical protein [Candidatus Neomarinimicrobiota bacterium]MCF7829779.1 hypothetical protein [Candidatus Neomarinimicrobiota bacterium]MCF7881788.1 hypothetical protein [Candidatus Neomarinimicrobiota bacterium]